MTAETHTRRVELCPVDEVPCPGVHRVVVDGLEPLAVVRLADGGVHVTSDTCTHADESLSEGDLEGSRLVCLAHFAEFDVRDGSPLCFPATRPLTVYPAVVSDGTVVIEVRT